MKILAIPDIHNLIEIADKILTFHPDHQKVIYTGDYFDSHWGSNQIELAQNTANWLKEKLKDEKNIMLFGNHDVSYIFDGKGGSWCSGFTQLKSKVINDIMHDDFSKLKPFHFENGILFSHAGVTRHLFGFDEDYSLPSFIEKLKQVTDEGIHHMKNGIAHKVFGAGYSRGGLQSWGGITWADFNEHFPLIGIPQIFGHTVREVPEFKFVNTHKTKRTSHVFASTVLNDPEILKLHLSEKAWSLGIDTGLKSYILLDTDKNEIEVYKLKGMKSGPDQIRNEKIYTFKVKINK